jgi:MinD-like ATPase involved in chromosome partitioning or flagellar assembly
MVRVVVYSPVRRQGSTTVSILLGAAIAHVSALKSCLTYTGTESGIYNQYLGIQSQIDRTKSINQMIRMMQARAVSKQDIGDYLQKLSPNLDLMHTSSETTNKEDSDQLLQYVFSKLPHDVVITDINAEPYEESTQKILSDADLVVIVVSQGMDVVNRLKLWRDSQFFPDPDKVVYVVNGYDSHVSAIRDCCKLMGTKYNKVTKLSMNPYIRKQSNSGKLTSIINYALEKDIRVIELSADLRDLVLLVTSNLGIHINYKGW